MAGKRIRIFAGPNGAGKSTLFQDFSKAYPTSHFINADLLEKILKEKAYINLSECGLEVNQEDFNDFVEKSSLIKKAKKEGFNVDVQFKDNIIVNIPKDTNSYEAAFVAAFIRQELIKAGKSFAFETVMSHPSKLEEIKQANLLGYKTYLYFVCTASPIINIGRIEARVGLGGHPVSDDKVEKRYFAALENLSAALKLCYRSYIFDNSQLGKYVLLSEFFRGESVKFHTKSYPSWFHKYVIQKMDF